MFVEALSFSLYDCLAPVFLFQRHRYNISTSREAAAFSSPVRERGVQEVTDGLERQRCDTDDGWERVPALSGPGNRVAGIVHALTDVAIKYRPFGPRLDTGTAPRSYLFRSLW
jgi:hypothetical protein